MPPRGRGATFRKSKSRRRTGLPSVTQSRSGARPSLAGSPIPRRKSPNTKMYPPSPDFSFATRVLQFNSIVYRTCVISRSARRPSCTACSQTCCQSPSRPTSCCRLDPPLQPSPRVATTALMCTDADGMLAGASSRLSTRLRSSSARGISFRQPRHATRTRTRTLTTHAAAVPTHISHLFLRSSLRTAPDDASRVVAQRPHQAMDAHHDHPRYYESPIELSLSLFSLSRSPADPLFSASVTQMTPTWCPTTWRS